MWIRLFLRNLSTAIWGLVVGAACLDAQETIDFNRDIRPILAENCFYCHGQDANKREADLRLDLREAAMHADAIVPGDPRKSRLVERILSEDVNQVMPPPASNRRLTAEQKKLLATWIEQGAPYANHWAFVSPKARPLPQVVKRDWIRNPIDAFVLEKLEPTGLEPSPEADRSTLIKRLYVDLIGLPPTIEEIEAFLADESLDAYEKLVDRLLNSPHYGERMALPWLDAARYADSNGFQQDGDTWQWIWRDWVIRALNANLPFDQFTIWQLAGDLLPNASLDQRIASGFNRNHLLNGEGGAIAEEQRWVNLFDRMDTTCTTWLGLTMACAQCHDHKYDPMTMRDYYSMLDAFNRVPESGTPQRQSARIRVAAPFLELPTTENEEQIARWEAEAKDLESSVREMVEAAYEGWKIGILADGKPSEGKNLPEGVTSLLAKKSDETTEEEKKKLSDGLRKHFDDKVRVTLGAKFPSIAKWDALRKQIADYKGDQIPKVMIMSDAKVRETSILERGEYLKPTEKVSFRTPEFLPPMPSDEPKDRLGLARWLVAKDHPLTARVQVNRIWQYYFGIGLVKTSEDFGVQSEYPIHLPLLDWLSIEFQQQGWDRKELDRLIVTSSTYRQSSRITSRQLAVDPENKLFGRATRWRMPSMILRDWALASSGLLDRQLGGAPVYPYQPDAVWEPLAITKERDFTYPASHGRDLYRRSIYTFWRRTVGPANMFDASNRQTCRVRLQVTSTPLHALTMLHDPTWIESARQLAETALRRQMTLEQRLHFAFYRAVCRPPKAVERSKLAEAFAKQYRYFAVHPEHASALLAIGESQRDPAIDALEHAALTQVCLGILNLDEAMTRE